jgi:hypothetical protein
MRRILVAVALMVGAVALTPGSPAHALYPCPTGYYCQHTWYADSQHTIYRGSYSINCQHEALRLGQNNGYLVYTETVCGDPPPVE